MKKNSPGFTLVEIMVVILITGILLAIAIPDFLQARETSRAKSCIASLRQIDSAKQQWAMASKAATTATCSPANIYPAYIRVFPTCPSEGTYSIGVVGSSPTCSIGDDPANASWSHVLP
jgi:prepilin-type N-terminal cleavage/methylation domain-containing protein